MLLSKDEGGGGGTTDLYKVAQVLHESRRQVYNELVNTR